MSLEQALIENTAAVKNLAALLSAGDNKVPPFVAREVAAKEVAAENKKASTAVVDATAPKTAEAKATKAVKAEAPKTETKAPAPKAATVSDYAPVKDFTLKLVKEKGREVALALLGEYGVERADQLKPEQYAEYVEAAKAKLETEEELA